MTKSTKIIAALGVAAGLGIAALPAGSIFAQSSLTPLDLTTNTKQSQNVTVSLTVGEAITLGVQNVKCATTDGAADAGAEVSLTVKATGSCSHAVAGSTNAAAGYTLSVKDADTNTALMLDGGADIAQNKIVAQGGALGGDPWVAGWNLSGGDLAANTAITTANQTVKSRATAGEDEFTMTYNFATRVDQNAGLYKDVITYTIAKN